MTIVIMKTKANKLLFLIKEPPSLEEIISDLKLVFRTSIIAILETKETRRKRSMGEQKSQVQEGSTFGHLLQTI